MAYLFDFNLDQDLRDSRLMQPAWRYEMDLPGYSSGIMRFCEMNADTLEWMIANRFADPEDCQNDSPTIREFLDFMHKYPGVMAIGYVVDKSRSDYRLTVEGLEYEGNISKEMLADIIDNYRLADEFSLDHYDGFRIWYD